MDTQTSNYLTGDSAFAVDRRGIIVLWNETAEKTLGYPASEALGKKCWKLLSGQDTYGNRYCCRHCPVREMAFKHEPVHGFQSTFNTSTNQPKQFAVSCLTILDDPGNEILLHICSPESSLMSDGGIRVPGSAPAGKLGALSDREIEVLNLLAEKTSTRDIAARLSISIRTVRTHIQHLMYKLQVHKRADAVRKGRQLRII